MSNRNSAIGLFFVVGMVFFGWIAAVAATPTTDALIDDLASAQDARQAVARQLLPLRGSDAAEKVIPLLDDERDAVYFAALRVLEDIVNETGGPIGMEDQSKAAQAVFSLLNPENSARKIHAGLNLLPLVIKEEHDLAPVQVLLEQEPYREPARVCLQLLGTRSALKGLCNALDNAEPSFKVALLRAIFAYDPSDELAALSLYLDDPDPAVQAAALRAFARTGHTNVLVSARRICAAAQEEYAFDAWDGWLRLTDAVAARGGNWETAMASYREILASAPYALVKSGAIVGMGRYGDDSVVTDIADALEQPDGNGLEAAALEAFRNLGGRAAHVALAAVYPRMNESMKIGMLALFGAKADPLFLEHMAGAVKEGGPAVRMAAMRALRESGLPEAAPIFQEILAQSTEQSRFWQQEQQEAFESLKALALRASQAGDKDGAGRAFLAMYRNAPDEAGRAAALEGIKQFPVPEAFDVVLELLAAGDIKSLPIGVMMGVAINANKAGKVEESKRIMEEIMPQLVTAEAVRSAVHAMRSQGANPEFARQLGYINAWHVTGPFPWNPSAGYEGKIIGEPEVQLTDAYAIEDKSYSWQRMKSDDAAALFNLYAQFGAVENAVAFAYSEIDVPEGGPAQVRLGSDDGARIWVNGEVVFEVLADRGYDIDQDIAEITLKPGKNVILAQITQLLGGWAFTVRLTHPDGTPLAFEMVE